MNEYLKSGRQALRLLYFLVISYSITKAIANLFTNGNTFALPTFHSILLFIVFLSFITRFFLGAYRILSEDIEIEHRRPKILMDVAFFFLQALVFSVFSLNYTDLAFTLWMILVLCFIDLVWLSILDKKWKIKTTTNKQWIYHNTFFICYCTVSLICLQTTVLLVVVSLLAMVFDLFVNLDFYFAPSAGGLRIFVAGPYGDNEAPNVIAKNIQQACDVGKQLALKGHFPFIPHTMLHGWEKDTRFTVEHFKRIDFKWLEFCDGLFLIARSPGADKEHDIAMHKGLKIFHKMEEVPDLAKNGPSGPQSFLVRTRAWILLRLEGGKQ